MRDAAADWARQAHAPEGAERDRTDDLNVFGRNVGGAAEPASPLNRGRSSGGGDPASVVILPGHHLRVEASAGHPLDGTAVEWDTVVRDDDWGVALGTGKSTLTFPSTACFDFGDLEIEFDAAAEWAGEATVTVKVNGQVRWEATGYGNDNGLSLSSGMLGAVTEGDTWSLHVDAPGAPAPTVVRVSMQRVEQQGSPVERATVDAPTTTNMVAGDGSASGSDSFSLSTGGLTLEEGDLLVAVHAGYSLDGLQGGDGSMSNPSGWDQQALVGSGRHLTYVLTRTATAADVSGQSYSFGASSSATVYHSAMIVRIPAANAGTLSAPNSDVNSTGADLSVANPAGDWTLAVAVGRNRRTSSTLTTVELSSPATTLASHDTGSEKGRLRLGEQTSGDTVGATFTATSGDPWGCLIAFGVTGGSA